jgi:hypothetical protein
MQEDYMAYRPPFDISVDRNNIIVRFKRDIVDQAALNRLLDYLELESVRKHSRLSEEQAVALSEEVNQAVWSSIKDSYSEA